MPIMLLADVYSTEEYTAVIFECIETDKPYFVTTSHKVKNDDIRAPSLVYLEQSTYLD